MDSDAILPSSPPRIDQANLPSSPLFRPQEHPFSPKSSSPPPLFSSDDSRDSIDVSNYESPRIFKNKRKGTWWDNRESAHGSPGCKKTKISRNFDSGVYMMSDATDSSEEMLPQHRAPFASEGESDEKEPPLNEAETAFNHLLRIGLERNLEVYEFRALDLRDNDISKIGDLTSIIKSPPDPGTVLPAEGQYRSMIPELYVNLSQNSLCRLTPSIFNIQTLTSLILRNNHIRELPPQIGQLQNLKTLDVSLNQLTFLPFEMLHLFRPCGSLVRLITMGNPLLEPMSAARFNKDNPGAIKIPAPVMPVTLIPTIELPRNEARRQLPYLYDSLHTCSDQEQIVWRIRLYESWTNAVDTTAHGEVRGDLMDERVYEHHPTLAWKALLSSQTPKYIARSLVCFFDQAGRIIKGSSLIPQSDDEEYSLIVETNRGTYGAPSSLGFIPTSSSRVASLLTTSLHNAFEKRNNGEYSIEDVRDMLPTPVPRNANAIIDQAIENDRGGYGEFRQCHVCEKKTVVPRAGWVEFWSVGYGIFFPFKVAVCSWACVPIDMMKKPEKELA